MDMKIRKTICVLCLFAAIGLSNISFAQNKVAEEDELTELQRQILELKQQMNEMKGEHESQINALEERIKELSERPGAA